MNITFAPRGILQIDDARLVYRNFEGRGDKFNREGDRNFAIVIDGGEVRDANGARMVDAQEMADILMNDMNRYGVGWNVKIKPAREEGDEPFIILSVKVRFNDRGPQILLKSGNSDPRELDEESVSCLDYIDISGVDLDIRPYDDIVQDKPFRAAYLQGMHVTQAYNRFTARYE